MGVRTGPEARVHSTPHPPLRRTLGITESQGKLRHVSLEEHLKFLRRERAPRDELRSKPRRS
eukprot:7995334-Alexandrium_andersonii.AAC.1